MGEPEPVDLIHLADADGNRCVVRVTGRSRPGTLSAHDLLCADVLASADFVDARLQLYLSRQDLADWENGIEALGSTGDATIGGDRGLSLDIHVHEDRSVAVTINDPDRLTAMIWIEPRADWLQDHRNRLGQVRQSWPSEVVETSPMVHERSPSRRG